MTIYEQIQRSLDFIERHLHDKLTAEDAAGQAFMSMRSYYTYFQVVTGYSFKAYIIKRRMAVAAGLLKNTDSQVVDIAFRIGYESHEAFSRAFKKEFAMTPVECRSEQRDLAPLEKIKLIKEMYMGVIVKELPEMQAVAFKGFVPNPEEKAFAALGSWKKRNAIGDVPCRVFGHNIDRQGNMSCDPVNEGYKVLMTIEGLKLGDNDTAEREVIPAGTFVVTGIEGNFDNDPEGKWISDGWRRMNKMVEKKGYRVHKSWRWYEEALEPSKPGNLRLDLYLEVELAEKSSHADSHDPKVSFFHPCIL